MDLSLASAFRYRRSQESELASDAVDGLAEDVKLAKDKVFVMFDGKHLKQDMDGEKNNVERLVIRLYCPALQREQLLGAFPVEDSSGFTMAEAVFGELVVVDLHDSVMGIITDTTASNFGPYSGAIKILQVELGGLGNPLLHYNKKYMEYDEFPNTSC